MIFELKPCPFCGSTSVDCYQNPNRSQSYKNGFGSFYSVKCNVCGVSTKGFYSENGCQEDFVECDEAMMAREAWNTRVVEKE